MLLSEFCAHKILSLKFVQIYADDKGTFCLIFHFILLVATIQIYYRNLESRNTTI